MSERRTYKNPPIKEAICQFLFNHNPEAWDLTTPGNFQKEIDGEYQGKPRAQRTTEIKLEAQEGQPPSSLGYENKFVRAVFPNKEGDRLVSAGPEVLAVHMLRPYQKPKSSDDPEIGWNEFKGRIERALKAYAKITCPKSISRISLRYVNKIRLPDEESAPSDYFKCALPEISGLPGKLNNYFGRYEYIHPDNVRIILFHLPIGDSSEGRSYMVDLDVHLEGQTIGVDEALPKVEMLRNHERDAFEAAITDKARELFDVER